MKQKSILILALVVLVAGGLGVLSFFGIGRSKLFGVAGIKQGLDLKGGVTVVYAPRGVTPSNQEMESALSLIRRRLDARNYTEAEVGLQGGNQIRVDVPGINDPEEAVSGLGKTALLTFKDEAGNTLLTGSDVADAQREITQSAQGVAGAYGVALEFTSEGKSKFADATSANIGKSISIFLDDQMLSSPTVQAIITDGVASISGSFTAEGAEELARSIREGSLPFALDVLSVSNVGAKLGANALQTGIIAGIIAIGLIIIFMVIFYRMAGVAADLALLIYTGLVLVILSGVGVNLTLPGIAGIILSIGMAVDANVIIFERIREEIAANRTLRASIDAGFERAFPAIVDSNVTTLIAAAVLFWLGTGPVKGFAQTLAIGIVVSMITALAVTRLIIKSFVGAGLSDRKLYAPVNKEAEANANS
ncbi:MAG: protein translocase subunit SecD [Clostridiales bacterium]|jgi:protein-export SecD/SecF family membrane protein|nr:protein translocase subunit SecD [Clostridiales bacterium]MDR2749332.1 protein translocase subunit SecD [Clostridiales bacterium]